MEQVGIVHIAVQDVCSVVGVLVISSIKVVIARDIDNLHVSSHERSAAGSWKANVEVKLLAWPLFFRIVEQKVMKPFWLSLRGTSQHYRC